ncbi:hypothetical protein IJJ08_03205 [bacterium]|nr:hypothetical protein [bacterium]
MTVIAITIFNFIPFINVHAEGGIGQTGAPLIQHRITVSPDIMTVYVGNVSVDGTSEIKYLYIENAVNSATVNNGLSKILTSDYSDMLARGTISSDGTVKVSNSHESDMSASWKNATNVANTYYGTTGTISDTSTTQINYNSTKYNEAVSNASALASAERTAVSNYNTAYNGRKATWDAENPGGDYDEIESYELPVITDNDLSTVTGEYIIIDEITRTGDDYFKYAMVNGHLTTVRLVDIDRTIVRIVNTSANVTTTSTTTKINNVNATIKTPTVGTKIVDENTKPNITLDSNANYTVSWTMFVNNYPSVDPTYDSGAIFGTTIEEGKEYYLEVYLTPKEGYVFDNSDNVTLKVNGGNDYELGDCSNNQFSFFTKVRASSASSDTPAPANSSTSDPNDRHASGDNVPNEARASEATPRTCTDAVPAGQADLFQIDRQGSKATLYFAPIPGAKTYHLTFGHREGDERFGGISMSVDDVSGVLTLSVDNLNPSQQYAFKIAPVNGCAVGEWSNWLTAPGVKAKSSTWVKTYRHN